MSNDKEDEKNLVKMCGYLEKKGNKMKMMSSWKLKWFVLKGRLLLYYRSKDEYEACKGPCKGSINLSPNCTVKPLLGTSCVFQIETRSKTIILKAKSRLDQEKWLQAILSVLNQNQTSTTSTQHFRYSSDDLVSRQSSKETENRTLSRQNTMPERYKLKKRQTFCGSLEDVLQKTCVELQKNLNRKSSSSQNLSKNVLANRKSEEIVNDLYSRNSNGFLDGEINDTTSYDKETNIYYRISSDSNESNDLNDSNNSNDTKRDVLDKNRIKENIYSKINDYVTQTEMDRIEKELDEREEIVENDQYCTAAIKIIETNTLQYHEYNLPGKDNIYSIPNVEIDQNENKISLIDDVNPYSICDIFPKHKSQDLKYSKDTNYSKEETIYDTPLDLIERGEKNKVESNEIRLQLVKNETDLKPILKEEEKKPQLPKKVNFLKKFFKLKTRKIDEIEPGRSQKDDIEAKKGRDDTEKAYEGDLVNRKVLEELQKLLVAKKESLKNRSRIKSNEHLATKKMLEELQNILMNKKEAKVSLNLGESKPIPPQKQPEIIYQEILDFDDKKDDHTYENTALIKIDKILNDLDDMKRTNNPFSTGKVKTIIAKFNNLELNQERTDSNPNQSKTDQFLTDYNVTLREKPNSTTLPSKNSSDELNLLLSELVKVTNAPILTPGVTTSLNTPPVNYKEEFGTDLDAIRRRRHSDPDYDVPRPHSNLNIIKNEVDKDDVFVATRFFGPVLLNYNDNCSNSNASTSMTPDSLEINANTSEASSYHSHYGKIIKQSPYFLHKQPETNNNNSRSNDFKSDVNKNSKLENKEEVFTDSLDVEGTTFL